MPCRAKERRHDARNVRFLAPGACPSLEPLAPLAPPGAAGSLQPAGRFIWHEVGWVATKVSIFFSVFQP